MAECVSSRAMTQRFHPDIRVTRTLKGYAFLRLIRFLGDTHVSLKERNNDLLNR
jgi:hypothetical protein